jgi:molybdopterin synthase catalytic subunit
VISVQAEDFDLGVELKKMTNGNTSIGGLCSFVGLVRDMADNNMISAMTLEHYPVMTEKALVEIEQKALIRWNLDETLIIHRYGRMEPGEQIVLVAAASAHRRAAFEACHFLIDWLKTKAPFWKLEDSPDGGKWVDARTSDDEAASRWNELN